MAEQQRTHWRNLFPTNYMGAHSFQNGESKVLEIAKLSKETLTGSDGKEEECIVVHWLDIYQELPLVLNKTNAENIATATGTQYVEEWPTNAVSLHVKKVKAFGEMKPAVRVGVKPPTRSEWMESLKNVWHRTFKDYKGEDGDEINATTKAKVKANELTAEFLKNSIKHMIDNGQ
jgi:hypothetical protein